MDSLRFADEVSCIAGAAVTEVELDIQLRGGAPDEPGDQLKCEDCIGVEDIRPGGEVNGTRGDLRRADAATDRKCPTWRDRNIIGNIGKDRTFVDMPRNRGRRCGIALDKTVGWKSDVTEFHFEAEIVRQFVAQGSRDHHAVAEVERSVAQRGIDFYSSAVRVVPTEAHTEVPTLSRQRRSREEKE